VTSLLYVQLNSEMAYLNVSKAAFTIHMETRRTAVTSTVDIPLDSDKINRLLDQLVILRTAEIINNSNNKATVSQCLSLSLVRLPHNLQCESKKSPPATCGFLIFFHKRLRILNQFFYTRSYLC